MQRKSVPVLLAMLVVASAQSSVWAKEELAQVENSRNKTFLEELWQRARSFNGSAGRHQPRPTLRIKENPVEREQRVITRPGAPEFRQPPPDIIGQPPQALRMRQ